jgi:ribose transport system ATP-binding protein
VDDRVEIRNMTKSFAGVTVLNGVNMDIVRGEVHGLVGENGSGKSTLVKIIAGLYPPDDGSACSIWGNRVSFPILHTQQHGIAIIHQDLALNDGMSVADNIGISSGYGARSLGLYRRGRELAVARSLIADFGLKLHPGAIVGGLAPAERSMVAILRALRLLNEHRGSGGEATRQLLILDEPTAALSREESQRLLAMIRQLARAGTAVVFIGHRLQEVRTVSDRISVLRSGKLIDTVDARTASESNIAQLMLGYELGAFYPDRNTPDRTREVLRVDRLSAPTIDDVSFSTYRGEILGISGLAGMGQDELPYLLFGQLRRTAGVVSVDGSAVPASIGAARQAGIALVPGNRERDAVWSAGTATENLTLPFVSNFARHWLLRRGAERTFTDIQMRRFHIRPPFNRQEIARFSGGNQQKLVLARWLQARPKVLLLHEPTQGVDAGAKKELFQLIREAVGDRTAVVIFSSDIEEIANMCHRVLILRHGAITAEIPQHQLSEDRIMAAHQGNQADSAAAAPAAPPMDEATGRVPS